mgnify:CR=1 FL=1
MRQNKKEVKKMKISEADLFEKIEAFLADYPICQYGFLKSEDILFSDKVRYICEMECQRCTEFIFPQRKFARYLPASCGRGCGL